LDSLHQFHDFNRETSNATRVIAKKRRLGMIFAMECPNVKSVQAVEV
jgi:cobalamin biosynthesis protein CobT